MWEASLRKTFTKEKYVYLLWGRSRFSLQQHLFHAVLNPKIHFLHKAIGWFLNMFYVCVLGNGYMIYATRLECPQIGVCFMDYKYKVLLRKNQRKRY